MTKVTYIPQNPSDPAVMPWHGIEFPANVPVELDPKNRKHGYNQLMREEKEDPVTGRKMFEYKETWVSMIELAKTNPSFQVEGEVPAVARKPGRPRLPRTSEDYRSYCLAWIASMDDVEDLAERWDAEEVLRSNCGVGDDDLNYLTPFFQAKHHELKKQAA